MKKQKNISWMYIRYSMLSSVSIALICTIVYVWKSEQQVYDLLWKESIASVPIGLFIMTTSLLIGGIVGYAIGYYIEQRIQGLNTFLFEVERGNFPSDVSFTADDEFHEVERKVIVLARRLEEQAGLFQKVTNERAHWNEEMRQEAISQERHRLARELHDSVSQQLFAMSMMMSAINEQVAEFPETTKKQLQLVENMVVNAQSEMRALLLHLRPVQLEGKKLTEGIEELLTELSRKQHMKIEWLIEPIELKKGVEDHLFRIVQEALSNTLRHAKAKKTEVRLRKIDQYAILKIIDDGVGFEVGVNKAGSYGLRSMQERVHEIGGTLKVLSFPNKGTQIEVKVPIMIERGGKS
ncbi:sensor histidine kinase [Bacillus cereus group sp. BY6-1LC]|uniref:sensor histidine kinase n=1 Tax=Bacillus cereus group sp. BY6-1LC TaxID=3018077 RepID=UPI0022E4EA26|nr:sensor histidine kinase [Bacillus cereus group sp. BY6-1LC]MDA1802489.1 sensor histidine kinase [Bacillus cereus group sp. BY6-1LC]